MMKYAIKKNNIVVVGDIMLDKYWFGDSSRISPEAPVPVVKIEKIDERLGGAGNVALNIAKLGARTSILAVVGNDSEGTKIKELLKTANVNSILANDNSISTTVKLRIIARNQQILRCDFEGTPKDQILFSHLKSYEKSIANASAVVFSDYAKGGLNYIGKMIDAANKKGILTLVDPKGTDFKRYKGATIITPNKKELMNVVGEWRNETELFSLAQRLREELNIKYLLLTRSEEGMSLYSDEGSITIPTEAKEVYDVSGAGDTVIATLAVALSSGIAIYDSIRLANKAAGIVVGKVGTVAISIEDLI